MPLISKSTYPGAPFYQFNAHLQTILPAIFRKIPGIRYERERFTLSDGDFVDLDWLDNKADQLVLLSHGLEGDANRHYMKGMAKAFSEQSWDVLAWNCRSCSGEMNKALRLYNHGEIGDIHEVITHALTRKNYRRVIMIGFSMGGNITMKYLGTHGKQVPEPIKAAIAFSAPADLVSSVKLLDQPQSKFYKRRFLKMLKPKIKYKSEHFPGVLDFKNYNKIKEWADFDNFFTAPLNGFANADEFYEYGSARNFMAGISIPTLLVNAENDPILTPECSPKELCRQHPHIYLETPQEGGHVGFSLQGSRLAWSELRALQFVREFVGN